MPNFLRKLLTFWCFATFFGGSLAIGLGVFPILFVFGIFDRKGHRRRCTRLVGWGYGTFLMMMRVLSLVTSGPKVELPKSLEGRPYIVISNHPTLIDVLFLLNWLPGSTCVVKGSWRRNPFFGPLLRSTNYIASDETSDDASMTGALDRMVEHVEAGFPLIIFPEGTRSNADSLHRFRRGAFEIAARTGAPILPVFFRVEQPFLMKGMPILELPDKLVTYDVEAWEPVFPEAGVSGRELQREFEQRYRSEFSAWVEQRERLLGSEAMLSPGEAGALPAE